MTEQEKLISDKETTELCKKFTEDDDEVAFEKIYRKYRPIFYKLLFRKKNLSQEETEEVLQRTFSKIAKNLPRLQSFDKFFQWAYTCCINCYKDLIKSKIRYTNRYLCIDDKDFENRLVDYDTPFKELDLRENESLKSETIKKALGKCPKKDGEILQLCVVKGFSYQEAADILNIPHGTVMSRLYYGRRRFIKIYNQEMNKFKNEKE